MSEEKLDSIRARIKLLSSWLEEREYQKQNPIIAPNEDNGFLSSLPASSSREEQKHAPIAPPIQDEEDLETRAEEKTEELNENPSDATQEHDASGDLEPPSERLLQQAENKSQEEDVEQSGETESAIETDITQETDITSEIDQSEALSELDNHDMSDSISIPPIGAVPNQNESDEANEAD